MHSLVSSCVFDMEVAHERMDVVLHIIICENILQAIRDWSHTCIRVWTTSLEKLLREPFVDRYYWWAPTELIRRLLIIILITAFPRNLVWYIIVNITVLY